MQLKLQYLGALWLLELISAFLQLKFKRKDICYILYILDTPNLCVVSIINNNSNHILKNIVGVPDFLIHSSQEASLYGIEGQSS